ISDFVTLSLVPKDRENVAQFIAGQKEGKRMFEKAKELQEYAKATPDVAFDMRSGSRNITIHSGLYQFSVSYKHPLTGDVNTVQIDPFSTDLGQVIDGVREELKKAQAEKEAFFDRLHIQDVEAELPPLPESLDEKTMRVFRKEVGDASRYFIDFTNP